MRRRLFKAVSFPVRRKKRLFITICGEVPPFFWFGYYLSKIGYLLRSATPGTGASFRGTLFLLAHDHIQQQGWNRYIHSEQYNIIPNAALESTYIICGYNGGVPQQQWDKNNTKKTYVLSCEGAEIRCWLTSPSRVHEKLAGPGRSVNEREEEREVPNDIQHTLVCNQPRSFKKAIGWHM